MLAIKIAIPGRKDLTNIKLALKKERFEFANPWYFNDLDDAGGTSTEKNS